MAEKSPFDNIYAALALMGVDPHDMTANFQHKGGRVAIAVKSTKVAIAIDGDTPAPLVKDGWRVVELTVPQIRTFSATFDLIGSLGFEHIQRRSESKMVKTGSSEERKLLNAILAANIREPDRNYTLRRPDGSELTTPDFTWADIKMAFFMDGQWWHVSKDDTEMLAHIRDAAEDSDKSKLLMNSNRTRAQRDADNRSEMQADGWRLLTCTDADLAEEGGVAKQVERIIKMMTTLEAERSAGLTTVQMNKVPSIEEILG